MKHKTNKLGGFTIIEVVLVLAVAGLIFLVVFAAIPRLQASRRDNARKRNLDAIYALVVEYNANTGTYPTTHAGLLNDILGEYGQGTIEDPSGDPYTISTSTPPAILWGTGLSLSAPGNIVFRNNASCNVWNTSRFNAIDVNGNNSVPATSSSEFAMNITLERGVYCIDGN